MTCRGEGRGPSTPAVHSQANEQPSAQDDNSVARLKSCPPKLASSAAYKKTNRQRRRTNHQGPTAKYQRPLPNLNVSRPGVHFHGHAAAADPAPYLFAADRSLYRVWLINRDRAGAGMSVQIESGVRWQLELHFAGTGVHRPRACGAAIRLNGPAAGFRLQRAVYS